MKKIFCLLFLIAVIYTPIVFAHEKYDDGWHIVPVNTESNIGKTWGLQSKEWAYYENGKETMRYSKLVGSHRGWGTAPENSLASFRITKEKGYYAFETDVRFTKDNVAVLVHDKTINSIAKNNDLTEIANDTFVSDLTYSQLKANYIFNIERVNHGNTPTTLSGYDTNRITSFEEMLDFVKANKMYVSIELKEGSKSQVESLVKMTQDKNMHNYVRWISSRTNLLKYVRDYDDDENLGVIKIDTCDSTHNFYCGEETSIYLEKLKTSKNMIWITNNPDITPTTASAINFPYNQNDYSPTDGLGTPIPQGKVTTNKSSLDLIAGSNTNVEYEYNGDGIVKCKSSNTNAVTCSVDTDNKTIKIKSIGEDKSSSKVMVYSTQGLSTSASNDVTIQINVESETDDALKKLENINISGYTFNFNKDTYTYKLKIKEEKELDIGVNLSSNDYTYKIEGNKDLENGSEVLIKILNSNNDVLLTYKVEIEKEQIKENNIIDTLVDIPDTFMGIPTINIIFSMIAIAIGITIFGYNYLIEK